MNKNHYVYILLNPLIEGSWSYNQIVFNNKPFYVGMGIGDRAREHSCPSSLRDNYNIYKNNIIKQIHKANKEVIIYKAHENLTILEAKELEEILISHFKRSMYSKDLHYIINNVNDFR